MIINSVLKKAAPHVPIVGAAYGFAKTCVKVYTASSPAAAVVAGCKGIIIDCTPPVVKYPALCAGVVGCTLAGCVTGEPNFFVGALECGKCIVDEV